MFRLFFQILDSCVEFVFQFLEFKQVIPVPKHFHAGVAGICFFTFFGSHFCPPSIFNFFSMLLITIVGRKYAPVGTGKRAWRKKQTNPNMPSIERSRWVMNRSKKLIKDYGWKMDKAMGMAAMEWREKHNYSASTNCPLTIIKHEDYTNYQNLLKQAAQSNKEITLNDVTTIMKPAGKGEWDSEKWGQLLMQTISNAKTISQHINIPDKWTVRNNKLAYG